VSGLAALFLLVLGADLMATPPRDLASFLDPLVALEQLQVAADETNLINVLSEQGTPPADGEQGDVLYVKKLFALRALEQKKSKAALGALDKMAKGGDVTLRGAAAQAAAAIRGERTPRPSGAESLKRLASLVPENAGFVVALDHERDSRGITGREYLEMSKRRHGREAGLLEFAAMEEALPHTEKGILQALAAAGNVRVDAAVIVFSRDLGERTGYMCAIIGGLYDPERMAKVCRERFPGQCQFQTHTVYYEPGGPAVCLLDEQTAVLSLGPGEKARHMSRALTGILAAQDAPLPSVARNAFEIVTSGKAKIALSGSLSDGQKRELRDAVRPIVERLKIRTRPVENRLGLAACDALHDLTKAGLLVGFPGEDGRFLFQATCTRARHASELNKSLAGLHTGGWSGCRCSGRCWAPSRKGASCGRTPCAAARSRSNSTWGCPAWR